MRYLFTLLLMSVAVADDGEDIIAEARKAVEDGTIHNWTHLKTVRTRVPLPNGRGGVAYITRPAMDFWKAGDAKTGHDPEARKPGAVFQIVLPREGMPSFEVTQITGPKSFLDLKHKLRIDGIDTNGLVDGQTLQSEDFLRYVGKVKGTWTYPTAGGSTNSVLHIVLALDRQKEIVRADRKRRPVIEPNSRPISESDKKLQADGFRVFRSKDWKDVRKYQQKQHEAWAKVIGKVGDRVRLKNPDGEIKVMRIKDFCDEDQKYLKAWKRSTK